ncbi:unnamed protein product [Sphagnum jensenii]
MVNQEHFLRQKYEVERLSIGQIAALVFSARSTVSKGLKGFGIPIRSRHPARKGQHAYGEKAVGPRLTAKMSEMDVIASIKRLHGDGYSLRQIAAWLDAKGIKTKNRRARWQAATVMKILRRK